MIRFIIPLKSRTVSGNWSHFSMIFERTLKSVCKQTNEEFEVIVVHHEKPRIEYSNKHVAFLEVDIPKPKLVEDNHWYNYSLKNQDKASKILYGLKYDTGRKIDYVMVVDSDDMVSKSIAQFVNKSKNDSNGWIISKGYFYREGKKFAFYKKKDFNLLCGSCLILKPELINEVIIPNPITPENPRDYYAHKTMEISGKKLSKLPFPGAVYSMANGENIQATSKNVKGIASRIFTYQKLIRLWDLLKKYRLHYLTSKRRNHFGIYNIQ